MKSEGGDSVQKLRTIFEKLKNSKANQLVATHLELPRITMIGDIHVYIENHQGIVRFTSNEIILNISNGYLNIKGSELVIKMLLTSEILIEGKLTALEMDQPTSKNEVKS